MATVATKARRTPKHTRPARVAEPRDVSGDVLTLAEAAAYLRLDETEVVRLVTEQGLPGRRTGRDWRFLKTALQDWLKQPELSADNTLFLKLAGKFRDDPFLEGIVADAYRQRGRPVAESAK